MNTQELRDLLNEESKTGNSRRSEFRKMINKCYKEDIKTLQQKVTEDCAFDLAYDIFMNTNIFPIKKDQISDLNKS